MTDDLKYTSEFSARFTGISCLNLATVKYSRQNGIHVSPTVLWDGLIANEISSSWGEREWTEFLEKKVTV